MRGIDKIIIHCADTKAGMDIGLKEITDWHTKPKDKGGRGWSDVGYHFIIRKDGTVERGRDLDQAGAHCYGQNANSIGICWVGGFGGVDDRNDAQKDAMLRLIHSLFNVLGKMKVYGHNEFSNKTCPNFNVYDEFKNLLD